MGQKSSFGFLWLFPSWKRGEVREAGSYRPRPGSSERSALAATGKQLLAQTSVHEHEHAALPKSPGLTLAPPLLCSLWGWGA